jgi:formylmethanofuran--tetrahydromethanopterin N-formyltransferase
MCAGILAICSLGEKSVVKRISAGNYGGKLGPHHFKLHELLAKK